MSRKRKFVFAVLAYVPWGALVYGIGTLVKTKQITQDSGIYALGIAGSCAYVTVLLLLFC